MNTKSREKEHSLCWDCAHATDGVCPWAERGEPVDGWWARSSRVRCGAKYIEYSKSYVVIECPLFKRDAWRGGTKEDFAASHKVPIRDMRDFRTLAALIIKQAVEDWIELEYGKITSLVSCHGRVSAAELIEFFHSGYFEELLSLCTEQSPEKVRSVLRVGDALLESY